jgi:hypothetical protein
MSNRGTRLVIKDDDVFKNKGYMKGVKSVTIHSSAIVSEFPTQEMVESPTLKSVNILGRVRKFRGDLLKKLKLENLSIVVYTTNMNDERILNISDPLFLKELTIYGDGRPRSMNSTLLKEISRAKNLEYLGLEKLYIPRFPDTFFQFPKLKYLGLRNNQINDPNELRGIHKLQNLEHLDLSYNEGLKRLPDSITKLKKLGKLHLFGIGGLESFPNNIGNMEGLFNIGVSHKRKINIPESILKLNNSARVEYFNNSPENGSNNLNGKMSVKNYYNRWKYVPRVPIRYINQGIPNNGASNSISYVNFKPGNTAMRIRNANRPATYMTVNTFKRLAGNRTKQGRNHIYKRRNDIKNIHDVYTLNGNTNVFINPMTTKMVKRGDIEFVKFI